MTLLEYIKKKSLLDIPLNETKKKPVSIQELLVENYKEYIIESPFLPMLSFEGKEMTVYFPTPYKYATSKDKDRIVEHTRDLIDKGLKDKPDRIYIDLRGNLGGDFSVFFASLYALLPDVKSIVTGVNGAGRTVAEIKYEDNVLSINIDGYGVYTKAVKPVKKTKIPVYVRINEKSMSSSQLIAVMFKDKYGDSYVIGSAPEVYTTGSYKNNGFKKSEVVFPYYYFKDNKGNIYKNGI